MAHALLSASSSKRWLTCTPSARLGEHLPNRSSIFAEVGTLAHAFCETKLGYALGRMTTEQYESQMTSLSNHELFPDVRMDAVDEYLSIAQAVIESAGPGALVFIEKRLDFSSWVPEGFGTGDLVVISNNRMWVVDYKNGSGVPVSANGNTQMRLYALGAINFAEGLYEFDKITMIIVQPNINNVSTEELDVSDLLAWGEEIKPLAQLAWDGKGEFVVSDECRFCPAKAVCKARAEHNLDFKKFEFEKPGLMSLNDIAEILPMAAQLKAWVGDLEEFALEQARDHDAKVPGFKLVEGRSNRKITNPDALVDALKAVGVAEALMFERSLLPLTGLEKLVGKKQFAEVAEPYIAKPPGALTLVPESDKREAFVRPSITDGFDIER